MGIIEGLKSIIEFLGMLLQYIGNAVKTSLMGLQLVIDALVLPAEFQLIMPSIIGVSCLVVTSVCAVKFLFGRQ